VEVDGYSMAPTLAPGQVLWCESHPQIADLRVGDIVVLGTAKDPPLAAEHRDVAAADEDGIRQRPDPRAQVARLEQAPAEIALEIKRLSALPERVESSPPVGPPPGYCEVRGDNPEHSADSRVFGPIPLRYIVARALWVPSPRRHSEAIAR